MNIRKYTGESSAHQAAEWLRSAGYEAEVTTDPAVSLLVVTTDAPDSACPQCVVCRDRTAWDSLDGVCSICDLHGLTKHDTDRVWESDYLYPCRDDLPPHLRWR